MEELHNLYKKRRYFLIFSIIFVLLISFSFIGYNSSYMFLKRTSPIIVPTGDSSIRTQKEIMIDRHKEIKESIEKLSKKEESSKLGRVYTKSKPSSSKEEKKKESSPGISFEGLTFNLGSWQLNIIAAIITILTIYFGKRWIDWHFAKKEIELKSKLQNSTT